MTNAQGIICGQRKIACLRVYTRSRCCEALDNVCKIQMLYVVGYMCTIVGVYSCAVDANQCVRGLQRVGCVGATICEVRVGSGSGAFTSLFSGVLIATSADCHGTAPGDPV